MFFPVEGHWDYFGGKGKKFPHFSAFPQMFPQ
jgi:hypothetical protein